MDRTKLRFLFIPLLLSCLLHAPLLVVLLGDAAEKTPQEPATNLVVRLVSEKPPPQPRKEPPEALPDPLASRSESGEPPAGQPPPESERLASKQLQRIKLDDPVDDLRVRKVLKQIKKKIIANWEQAEPPALGTVSLELEVLTSGTTSTKWITELKGPEELGDFILDLMNRIDFSDLSALETLKRPLLIECTFDVSLASGKSGM